MKADMFKAEIDKCIPEVKKDLISIIDKLQSMLDQVEFIQFSKDLYDRACDEVISELIEGG